MSDSVVVIAEAGVNHNGNLDLAERLIDVAAKAKADFVKFQTFRAVDVVSQRAPKADYQLRTTDQTESQLEMIRDLELSDTDHEILINRAHRQGVRFLSAPFDISSVDLLTKQFGLEIIKVPSGEITNAPLLLSVARAAQQVIVSTGMSTLAEVEAALGVLAFGFTAEADASPQPGNFEEAFVSEAGQQFLRSRVTLLHCTSEYPAPYAEVNLRAMDALAVAFGLPVGYSDHTIGIHLAVAAVARGAKVIEKHLTLDRSLPGPDHKASLEPDELHEMVRQIRDIEQALGNGVKRPTPSEMKNRCIARKGLVAAKGISKGETFTELNVTCKRPGGGKSPFAYWELLGQVAARDYAAEESIAD